MRKTRRFASFALAACMGVSLLVNVPAGTASAAETDTAVEAENAAESVTEETEVIGDAVTETDATETSEADFVWDGTKITKYIGTSTEVVIPSKCTEIGYSTFAMCKDLTSVVIPDSVTEIGSRAFSGCSSLTNITIPDSVTSIGEFAFGGCSSMSSITIPGSVTQIGNLAFQHCSASLTSIMVDDSNPVYDSRENCNAIIETASNKLLYGCSNTKIPNSVTEIGSGAFLECKNLTRITIPDSVKKIGNAAFYFCTDLTSVNIPDSVKEINFQAFYVCRGLTSITIPKSVESIDSQAFAACSGLTSIKVASENPVYDSRENCNAIINTADNELIVGCKNTKIPDNVTKIGGRAFEGCDELVSIKIPDGVTSIENAAFSFCDSLTSIMIPQSVTYIDDNVFGYSEQFQTIRGYSGSYAETYAKENGYTFVDLNAPAVPTVTNVKAVPAGKNKVNVTWNKVNGATGYIVYAKKNGKYAKLGVTAATSYTDKAALDNDYNFYFVYAYKKDSAGKIVVGKCQKYAYAKGTCKAVTNLKASSVKGGVKVTWTKSVGADGYIIYGKHPGGTYGYVGMTSKNTVTSFTDKGADKKNYNFYWVFPYHNKNGKRVIGPICGYVYGKAK